MHSKENQQKIQYFDREKKTLEQEKVYGAGYIEWLYRPTWGKRVVQFFFIHRFVSWLYGLWQDSHLSRRKIEPFVKLFQIPMADYVQTDYASFNDFFIREFRPLKRPFCISPQAFPAFCEGRYVVFDHVVESQMFPVKGGFLSAAQLMGSYEKAKPFIGGGCIIARLCPVDYHRFHFPDAGFCDDSYRIPGVFHSVNPIALRQHPSIFVSNERHVSILTCKHFGQLAYIEVGALMVGKIIQTHLTNRSFGKGEQKGYFHFGGSTVIVLSEPGKLSFDPDLLHQTAKGRETLVKLGDQIARIL